MDGIYLLLGTNLGDRHKNLDKARQLIEDLVGEILKASGIYKTKAWGKEDQPDFLNQVVCVSTSLKPEELLQVIHQIEEKLGRVRKEKWGERVLDLDILFYNNIILQTPELTIPHPEIPNRKFTLVPLCEIAGDTLHPVLKKTQQVLLDECKDPLPVELCTPH